MGLFDNHHQKKENKEVTIFEETNVIIIDDQHYKKWHPEKEELEIIEHLIRTNDKLTKIIDKLTDTPKSSKPIFAITIFINNEKFITMADVSLVVGTPKTGVFTLLDGSLVPITSASFSNQVVASNSNPELADISLDPSNPNQVIGNGLAAGSGTAVITTDAAWTDGSGNPQSGSFSVTKNYTVTPATTGGSASFDVVFP